MTRYRASAPGKAVLFGEYAVLEGAEAIVAAVDRRAEVRVCDGTGKLTTSLSKRPWQIDWSKDHPFVAIGHSRQPLIESVLAAFPELATRPIDLTIDTAALYGSSQKLGLGSSAAVTVALHAALAALTGRPAADRESTIALLRQVHANYQGGRGSGIDIAASVSGGIVCFMVDNQTVQLDSMGSWLPPFRFFAVGKAASTKDFLAHYFAHRTERGCRDALAEIANAARCAKRALAKQDSLALIDAVDQAAAAMRSLGDTLALPVVSEPHLRLMEEAARDATVAYKPCGAGGGDIGLAVASHSDNMVRFAARARALGADELDISVDPKGVLCR